MNFIKSAFRSFATMRKERSDGITLTSPKPGTYVELAGYEAVGPASELPPLSEFLLAAGEPLCIVNSNGQVRAIHNICPHKQANLHLGDIEDSGNSVTCPRHRKKFPGGFHLSCDDGRAWLRGGWGTAQTNVDETWCVPVYDVQVKNGIVYVSQQPKIGSVPQYTISTSDDEGGKEKGEKKKTDAVAAGLAAVSIGAASAPSSVLQQAAPAVAAPASSPASDMTSLPEHVLAAIHYHQRHSMNGDGWTPCRVASIQQQTLDSYVYRLEALDVEGIDTPRPSSRVPPTVDRNSWHLSLRVSADPASISREYTPISSIDTWEQKGVLELLIKIYPSGRLTSVLSKTVTPGSVVFVSQPETTLALPSMLPPDGHVHLSNPPVIVEEDVSDVGSVRSSTTATASPRGTVAQPASSTSQSNSAGAAPPLRASSTAEGNGNGPATASTHAPADAHRDHQHHQVLEVVLKYDVDDGVKTSAAASGSASEATAGTSVGADGGSGSSEANSAPTSALASAHLPVSICGPGSAVLLVGGGTGVTPLLQLASWCLDASPAAGAGAATSGGDCSATIVSRPERVYILLSNHTDRDVLMRERIAELAAGSGGRLRVMHTFTRMGAIATNAQGGGEVHPAVASVELLPSERAATAGIIAFASGRINAAMLKDLLSSAGSVEVKRIIVSGPSGMFETVRHAVLEYGFDAECLVELEA